MLFKEQKKLGYGAIVVAELRLGSKQSGGGGILMTDVPREDMEELLENLKNKVLKRFYG